MSIDLKHDIILQRQIKKAVHDLAKAVMIDIDENEELNIVQRGFEIQTIDNREYRVVLSISER